MHFKTTSVLLLSCVIAVYAADINTIRKEAIKRIDAQVLNVKKLADTTSLEVEKVEENVKIIGKHEREYGDGIIESTRFQVAKNAKSAYMLANLLAVKDDVYKCIDYRVREAKDDIDKYYSEKFVKPGLDYVSRAEQFQRDTIKAWKDDYYKANGQYQELYKKAISDINRATSEGYIINVLKSMDQNTEQMGKIITNILPNLNNIHGQILRILENLVAKAKEFARYRVDKTFEQINQCFPRVKLLEEDLDLFEL